ncbi:MAG: hypothetical protein AB1716_14400 [Planctomycetota bacterium]
MNTNPKLLLIVLAAAAGLAGNGGCQRAQIEFTSYRDPYFPEHFEVDFQDCVYRSAPAGDLLLVGHAHHSPKQRPDAEAPHIGQSGRTDHYLQVHMFWKPRPGKTFADASGTDAVITYVVTTEQGTLTYVGAGFVFPRPGRGSVDFEVESGRLRLATRSGELSDVLGDTRLRGTLRAREDPAMTTHLSREAEVVALR